MMNGEKRGRGKKGGRRDRARGCKKIYPFKSFIVATAGISSSLTVRLLYSGEKIPRIFICQRESSTQIEGGREVCWLHTPVVEMYAKGLILCVSASVMSVAVAVTLAALTFL